MWRVVAADLVQVVDQASGVEAPVADAGEVEVASHAPPASAIAANKAAAPADDPA